MLSDTQIDRYSRQIVLPGIGGRGQTRLLASRLLVISALGELETALPYLVGAGVGTISLCTDASAQQRRRMSAWMRDLNPDAKLIWDEGALKTGPNARPAIDALLILSATRTSTSSLAKPGAGSHGGRNLAETRELASRLNRHPDKSIASPDRGAGGHGQLGRRSCAIERRLLANSGHSGSAAAQSLAAHYSRMAPAPTVAAHLGEPMELVVLPARPPCLQCIRARCLRPGASRAPDWEMAAAMAVAEALKLLLMLSPPQAQVLRFRGLIAQPKQIKPRAHCRICAR